MLQPAKVAAPATAVTGFAVHANTSPAGVVIANVTALVSVVTVLPPASVMLTTGWVAKGWRLAASVGWVVNRSLVAGPIVMVTGSLIAGVNKPSVAVRVWVPATSMLHAEKVAMPATAGTGFAAHPNTVNMGTVMPSLTELVSVVTVLPPASLMVTTGWVGNATPPV